MVTLIYLLHQPNAKIGDGVRSYLPNYVVGESYLIGEPGYSHRPLPLVQLLSPCLNPD